MHFSHTNWHCHFHQSILNVHPANLLFLIWLSSIPSAEGQWWADDPNRQQNVDANHMPTLNDKCDYRTYIDFFKEVATSSDSATPYNKVVGKEYYDHPHATKESPKKMNPSVLCIRTDDEKNIDINQFDCLPDPLDIDKVKGHCGCGNRWSRIDLNDPIRSYIGLNLTSHSYEYYAYNGLDKFLTKERKAGTQNQFECVANRFGHCTLDYYKKNTGWNITKCKIGFKCRNISVWSPIKKSAIVNVKTGEWYGLCISEQTPDELLDPFANGSPAHCKAQLFSLVVCTGIIFLTFQKLLSMKTH